MTKHECIICGYIYDPLAGDPENGAAEGTAFESLPNEWVCPDCGAEREEFDILED